MTDSIAMIVAPHFNAAATMAFLDPLRATNYLTGRALFEWRLLSVAGGAVPASNGVDMVTTPLAEHSDPPFLGLVSTSWTPEAHAPPDLLNTLRRWARFGAHLGGLDTGAFVLAEAGLLEGRRATVHYEHMDAFAELHPGVALSEDLFVVDGKRWTAAGGGAATDLGLHLVRSLHGADNANAAARYVFHERIRASGERQLPEHGEPSGATAPPLLHAAIRLMEAHLEETLPIAAVAARLGVSPRHLARLFRAHTGRRPVAYYRDIRLDRARALVTQTVMPLGQIAPACGFASAESFSRSYRRRFGLPPRADRVAGRVPFEFRAWPMGAGSMSETVKKEAVADR